MLAKLNRSHRDRRVSMIWCSDNDRVDVFFFFQEVSKIAIPACAGKVRVADRPNKNAVRCRAMSFRGAFFSRVHIAEGCNPRAGVMCCPNVVATHSADADPSNIDRVAG